MGAKSNTARPHHQSLTPLGIFTRLHLRGNFPDVSLLAMGGLSIAASFLPLTVVIDTLITARILI